MQEIPGYKSQPTEKRGHIGAQLLVVGVEVVVEVRPHLGDRPRATAGQQHLRQLRLAQLRNSGAGSEPTPADAQSEQKLKLLSFKPTLSHLGLGLKQDIGKTW